MNNTSKLPIVVDEFVCSLRSGVAQVGFFARIAPYGAADDTEAAAVCVSRIALSPDALKLLIAGLQQTHERLIAMTGMEEVDAKMMN